MIDYKKNDKVYYLPETEPVIVQVPAFNFLMVDGAGAPAGEAYKRAVEMLYALSYTIKMKGKELPGYKQYAIYPLEGLWSVNSGVFSLAERGNWVWTSMIRQPDFVTPEVLEWARDIAQRKKPELDFTRVRLEKFEEGLCVQMMHHGPYLDEPANVERMYAFMAANGLRDDIGDTRHHHEIYLNDPNRVAPEKMRTVLRHPAAPLG